MDKKKISKNLILYIAGIAILIIGITLVLIWWSDLVVVFRGVIGMILALAGLIILFMIKE